MDKTEKAVLFEIHNMVSEMKTQQALQGQKVNLIEKEMDSAKKDLSKLKTFMIQSKVAVSIIITISGGLFALILKYIFH